jgi:hypothetical protein
MEDTMNGDPHQEPAQAPQTPEKEKEDKPADGDKAAKEGSCGTSSSGC